MYADDMTIHIDKNLNKYLINSCFGLAEIFMPHYGVSAK